MDFLDYREKLGFTSSDSQKFLFFKRKIFNVLDSLDENDQRAQIDSSHYYKFCNACAVNINKNILYKEYESFRRYSHCVRILHDHSESLQQFLLYYITLANSVEIENDYCCNGVFLISILKKMLDESHIPYEVQSDNEEFFVFPKGAKELDDALVSEPLIWLEAYPKAHATFCRALKQYSDGEHTRDVADNLRKALEEFLQEYLGNDKNLEKNKNEVCKCLGEKGVDAEFCSMIHSLLNTYKTINDKYAKHHDALDEKLLEFILYQTGVFIRMLIVVK